MFLELLPTVLWFHFPGIFSLSQVWFEGELSARSRLSYIDDMMATRRSVISGSRTEAFSMVLEHFQRVAGFVPVFSHVHAFVSVSPPILTLLSLCLDHVTAQLERPQHIRVA